jgi:hemin uptake protein HemP
MTQTLSIPVSARIPSATEQVASLQPSMSSNDILRGQKAVEINHNGSTYKLQATRLGKLILTK